MARPVNADSARTRARVLDVAIRHFGRDGFRAATMRRIAADVGVTFPTIHHHFGAKASLFAACLSAAFEQLRGVGRDVISVLMSAPEETRLERAVRHAFRAASENRPRSRFLLRTFVFEDEALVASHIKQHRVELLDAAVAGLASANNAELDVLRIRFIGFGMLVTRLAAASSFELTALSDEAYQPGGIVEDYLIDVARATLGSTLPPLPRTIP